MHEETKIRSKVIGVGEVLRLERLAAHRKAHIIAAQSSIHPTKLKLIKRGVIARR